jgi:hypothetical protein
MADMMRNFGNSAVQSEHPGFYCWDLIDNRIIGDGIIADLFGFEHGRLRSGVSVEEILARIVPGDRERVAKAIHTAILTGELYKERYHVTPVHGRVIEVIALGRCLHDEDGQPTSWAGTVRYALADEGGDLKALCRQALAAAEEQGHRSVVDQLRTAIKVLERWGSPDRLS